MTTKRLSLIGVSVLIISLLVAPLAVAGDTANADATAKVIQPITISPISVPETINFGTFSAPEGGVGTVTVTANSGGASGSCPLTNIDYFDDSNVGQAEFNVSGATSHAYGISVSTSALTDGGSDITFASTNGTNFTSSSGDTTLSSGSDTVYVGGKISIPSGLTAGTYACSSGITVTATYE